MLQSPSVGNPKILNPGKQYVPPDGLPSITELNQRIINANNRMAIRNIAPQVGPQTILNSAWQIQAIMRILIRAGICTEGDCMYFMALTQCEDMERLANEKPPPAGGLVLPAGPTSGN